MRRIDLFCNLFGPFFIALIDGFSTKAAIIVNLAMNVTSVVVEYFAIARVYHEVPKLQEPKHKPQTDPADSETTQTPRPRLTKTWRHAHRIFNKSAMDFSAYFHHRAFLPSFAGALLYFTVLSFASQMITYLLSVGYSATQVGITRTLSVAFEVLSTWVAPWLMGRLGPVRAGLWLSSWQLATLIAGTAVFWIFNENPDISASGLVGGTILSRLGLRGFDLVVQFIVQEVRAGVEASSPVRNRADSLCRKSKLRAVARSRPLKRHGRTPLSCCLSHRPSSFPAQISSSGPRSYPSGPLLRPGQLTVRLSICGEDICFI
jgi:iron-regulated transporter 1